MPSGRNQDQAGTGGDGLAAKYLGQARSITIEVRDYGPLQSGRIELRPLTMLTGASRSGKTLLARTAYALLCALADIQDELGGAGQPDRDTLAERFGKAIHGRFAHCFGTDCHLGLIRADCAKASLSIRIPHISTSVYRFELAHAHDKIPVATANHTFLEDLAAHLASLEMGQAWRPVYLPAQRGAWMHLHQAALADGLVAAATAGHAGIPQDFLARLAQPYDPGCSTRFARIAKRLEAMILGGEVQAPEPDGVHNGYAFRPLDAPASLPVEECAPLVGGLAPLAVFLHHGLQDGGLLFIEEPEAHLDAALQYQLLELLACCAEAGLQVVMTTHSGCMLEALANVVGRAEVPGAGNNAAGIPAAEAGVWMFGRTPHGGMGGSMVKEGVWDVNDGGYATGFEMEMHTYSNEWGEIAAAAARQS